MLFVSGQFGEALNKLGLVAELDHSKIPNLANLYPEAMKLSQTSSSRETSSGQMNGDSNR